MAGSTAASWYLVKYMADPRRREPRNVGVLLRHRDQWLTRFAGEQDGEIQARSVRSFGLDPEVYRTWVDYYRRKAAADAWEDVERLQRHRIANFYAEPAGMIVEDNRPAEALLDELFRQMVTAPKISEQKPNPLRAATVDVLTRARVSYQEDVTVPARFSDAGKLTTVSFPLGYQNGQVHLMDMIPITGKAGMRSRELWARIRAASLAESAKSFLVFYSAAQATSSAQEEEALLPLEETAITVDVDDRVTAAETVADYVGA